jgi:myo-inositol-1(or 4)-monophosphatase
MPSVAAMYKDKVLAGVIYDPHRDEVFSAVRGRAAYMNEK